MMVMWEHKKLHVKEIGECLYLDSGTLTPVLKKLEEKGFVIRTRSKTDERNLEVSITTEGEKLKERAKDIPEKMGGCVNLNAEESIQLYALLNKLLGQLN